MKNAVPTKLFVLAIILWAVVRFDAVAADVQQTTNKLCVFKLDGSISLGDADRLSSILSRSRIDPNDERTSAVCLKSNGGSYAEGLKLAELIYDRGLSTVIEYGSECYSACALIFMAGVASDRIIPMRKLSVGGVLGFHAPYLTLPDEKYSKTEAEMVAQSMRAAILALVKLSSKRTQLAGNDFLKKSLIYRILEKGPADVFFVKTVADAARWDILVYDAAEHFRKPSNIDGVKNVCNNFHYANMDEDVPSNTDLSLSVEKYSSKFHKDDARILVKNAKTNDTVCELYPRTFRRDDQVKFYVCSHDYWSSKSFGDCRDYKSAPAILVGKFVPEFFLYNPTTLFLRFKT